ncbi:hypothetical protein FKM82_005171 [Ascaphus truei]
MANPSIISSSCELDSRLLRLGGLAFLAEADGFFPFVLFWLEFSFPKPPSASDPEEGLWFRGSLAEGSLLLTLSLWDLDRLLCFILTSIFF